jgi:Mn-dependent DtxR family transcriptional regulator
MKLSNGEIEVLKVIERTQAEGAAAANVEDIADRVIAQPAETAIDQDRTALHGTLRKLHRKNLISFEAGTGVHITESGIVALRAL